MERAWNFRRAIPTLEQRGSYLYRNGDVVGKLQKPYCLAVRDRRHYFRKYDGFALAVESHRWLLDRGFIFFEVHYKPENKVVVYRVTDFPTGYKVDYPPHGEQYVLPISKGTRSYLNKQDSAQARNNQSEKLKTPF